MFLTEETMTFHRYHHFRVERLVDETLSEAEAVLPVDEDSRFQLVEKILEAGVRELVLGQAAESGALLRRCAAQRDKHLLPADARFTLGVSLSAWEDGQRALAQLPAVAREGLRVNLVMTNAGRRESQLESALEKIQALGIQDLHITIPVDFQSGQRDQYGLMYARIFHCLDSGVREIHISDYRGGLYPENTESLCRHLTGDFPDVGFCLRTRDDRGLALSNALISVYAGFTVMQGALAGMSCRSVLPAMELIERIARDKDLAFGNARLDAEKLAAASRFADEIFMRIPPLRPGDGLERDAAPRPSGRPDAADGTDLSTTEPGLLNPKLIREILRNGGFNDRIAQDEAFVADVIEFLSFRLEYDYRRKRPEYLSLVEEFRMLHRCSCLSVDEIRHAASLLSTAAGR